MNLAITISRSKNKLIILLLLFITWHANSQGYIPMLGDTNVWTYSSWPWENVAIITTEDSVYNTIKYKKILHEDWFGSQMGYTGLLREDEEKKQVWYIEPDSTKERIIYDFSLIEGDSIWLQYNDDAYGGMLQDGWYYVDSIRTRTFFDTERRVFYLDNPYNQDLIGFGSTRPYIEWIEGVGSNLHPTYFVIKDCAADLCHISFIYGASIICAFKNDAHIYQDYCFFPPYTYEWTCYSSADTENLSDEQVFEIYPNPAKDYFFVKYNFGKGQFKDVTIQISDTKGLVLKEIEVAKSTSQIKIATATWKRGIYMVHIKSGNTIIESWKIVVE